jgi:hypothetical protein
MPAQSYRGGLHGGVDILLATSLPHKPQKKTVWRREGHNLTLLLQSGVNRSGTPLGLPYGSYARFILLFLQSQAIKTGSREMPVSRMPPIGLPVEGENCQSSGSKFWPLVRPALLAAWSFAHPSPSHQALHP